MSLERGLSSAGAGFATTGDNSVAAGCGTGAVATRGGGAIAVCPVREMPEGRSRSGLFPRCLRARKKERPLILASTS